MSTRHSSSIKASLHLDHARYAFLSRVNNYCAGRRMLTNIAVKSCVVSLSDSEIVILYKCIEDGVRTGTVTTGMGWEWQLST